MDLTPVIYGVATAAAAGWCVLTVFVDRKDGLVTTAAAFVVALGWVGCRWAEYGLGWDISPDVYALIDILSCAFIALLYGLRRWLWLAAISALFACQSVTHLLYQAEGQHPGGIYSYLWLLNSLYCAILGCLIFGGRGAVDVLRDFGRSMRARFWRVRGLEGSEGTRDQTASDRAPLDQRGGRDDVFGHRNRRVPTHRKNARLA